MAAVIAELGVNRVTYLSTSVGVSLAGLPVSVKIGRIARTLRTRTDICESICWQVPGKKQP